MTKFNINNNDSDQTIFSFIKKAYKDTPLSVIYKWFRKGNIKLNNKKIKDLKLTLSFGDILEVFDSNKPKIRDEFNYIENNKIDVIYEDDNLLVINKQPNLEVHSPINISLDDKVKTYLFDKKEYNPTLENSFVVSHIHRLDKLTSGLIMYAKNKKTLDTLLEAIKDKNQIEKYYIATISDKWEKDFHSIGWIKYDSLLQKSIFSDKEKKYFKTCETKFKLLKEKSNTSDILVQIITGRKHQIRAVLSFYGFPILNDFKYGGQKINNDKEIYLKSYKLIFKNLPPFLDYLNNKEIKLIEN